MTRCGLACTYLCAALIVALGCKPSAAPKADSKVQATSPFAVKFDEPSDKQPDDALSASPSAKTCCSFVDVASQVGLNHTHENGARGLLLMVESTGGGGGWLDYDADGFWDIYLNQGGDASRPPDASQPNDQLFRNRDGHTFENVTQQAWIEDHFYGQGVAVGDFDNDGFDDIYVLNVGRNTLFRNQGDGTFQDVTLAAGVGDLRWSSSGAWGDLDRDGLIDLYVCNYCDYDPLNPILCERNGRPRICHPKNVEPIADEFYRNRGDGTFSAESSERGLFGAENRGLCAVIADLDNDEDPDVFVANDTTANFLFINDGKGNFTESASVLGCAVDRNGATRANMGLACADFDRNGWLDIYSTNFYREGNMLFRNLGEAGFEDVTGIVGLHTPVYHVLGFGTVMIDFDLDGSMELLNANGHIEPPDGTDRPFEMESQIFEFDGKRWRECSAFSGDYFRHKRLGRGLATCDFDADGDVDVCIIHQNTPVSLLRNEARHGHGLQFRFIGTRGDRRGVGTRVTVRAGDKRYMQELCGGTSYAVSHQPMLTFGLGDWDKPVTVEIRWPYGQKEVLENVAVDQVLVLREP